MSAIVILSITDCRKHRSIPRTHSIPHLAQSFAQSIHLLYFHRKVKFPTPIMIQEVEDIMTQEPTSNPICSTGTTSLGLSR